MHDESSVLGWRWRIGKAGPPIQMTLPFAEAVRSAMMSATRRIGLERLPDAFHHSGTDEHTHAYWLPEDEDNDGLIDHVLVYAKSGIEPEVVTALAHVRKVSLGNASYLLSPDWMGREPPSALACPSRGWQGITPYVTPLWRLTKTGKERPDFTPDAQLLGEFERMKLPAAQWDWNPARWTEAGPLVASAFEMRRANGKKPNKEAVASFLNVEFPKPVPGPLAFGYGAHFGLGLLRAMPSSDAWAERRSCVEPR